MIGKLRGFRSIERVWLVPWINPNFDSLGGLDGFGLPLTRERDEERRLAIDKERDSLKTLPLNPCTKNTEVEFFLLFSLTVKILI